MAKVSGVVIEVTTTDRPLDGLPASKLVATMVGLDTGSKSLKLLTAFELFCVNRVEGWAKRGGSLGVLPGLWLMQM